MITPSGLWLANRCSYPFRDDVPQSPERENAAGARGTVVHKATQAAVIFGSSEPPAIEDAETAGMVRNALKAIAEKGPPTLCEAGFLYDTRNDVATLGPARGEPGYETAPPGFTRGTWDLVWVYPTHVDIWDIKSGAFAGGHPEQLHMQAVAASRLFGVPVANVAFLFVRKTKFVMKGEETLDADRLDDEAGKLHRLVRRLPTAQPRAGEHCFRCDLGRDFCPAYGAAIEEEQVA